MARLTVRVTPRSSRDGIDGFDEAGVLRLRVTAPPAEGAANKAVAKLLARTLGVPSRDIVLIRGARGREKTFDVPLDQAELRRRLATWLGA